MPSFVNTAFEMRCFEVRYDVKLLVELAPERVI